MDEDSPWGDEPSRAQPSSNTEADATPAAPAPTSSAPAAENRKPQASSAGRSHGPGKRVVRKFNPQSSTTLEALDDSLGPLGPLGDNAATTADTPPAPPQKETPAFSAVNVQKTASPKSERSSLRNLMESVDLGSERAQERDPRPRIPPPVEAAFGPGPLRTTPSSVSVEQASKPRFDISVGDPHKVGDLTSSHTVYQVRTKTTSKAYRIPEFTVSRRYRDFLWLYNQLHNNAPGVVVPPPPEKQAVGRFDHNFVESRRQALERMLVKITSHPILQHDGDLKLFLESESFNIDIKHKERKDVGLPETKGGVLSSIGLSVGGGSKFIEHDDWFHDRRIYLDALENQLKALLKSTDAVVAQRKALAESCADLSNSLHTLATVEISPALSAPIDGLSDVQLRIRDLYDRQAQQDMLTLGIVIDEYIRLIGSVKTAFGQRQKAFHAWHAAESSLAKLKASQDKLLRAGRTQQDRLGQMQADVADSERRVHQARLLFDDMGRLMRNELDRFEREKVEDFKSSVETFLESAVEAQKELIEIWETYLVQLDADEEGVVPFSGQAGVHGEGEAQNNGAQPEGHEEGHEEHNTDAGSSTAVAPSTDGGDVEQPPATAPSTEG